METQKSNKQLQVEVREELTREPTVDSDAIGITADHGLIFLSGHVLGVTQRGKAEESALRVDGVQAVIDELKIRPGRWETHDADLACLATDSLKQMIGLPDGRVKVVVREGNVCLKGTVSRPDEAHVITATVRSAIGRDGSLDDTISVEPGVLPELNLADPRTASPSEPGVERLLPESSMIVLAGEAYTGEGIPIRRAHHREFPEIRGEGETRLQCVSRLAQQLELAREHAREDWQREGIDHAIREVKAYHASLMANASGDTPVVGPGETSSQLIQLNLTPLSGAAH